VETVLFVVLGNFFVTFLVLGLIAAGIRLALRPKPLTAQIVVEDVFAYFLLFAIGLSFVYNFAFHVFAGEFAASLIGWADSPFQDEVGWASLGMGLVGVCAFRGSLAVRGVAILGPACFLLGAAGTHIVDIIVSSNFAPGNAGAVLYTDIALPLIGAALWFAQRHLERRPAAAPSASTSEPPASMAT
jgi:hypothetical protein